MMWAVQRARYMTLETIAPLSDVGDTQSSPSDYYSDPDNGSLPCTDQNYEAIYKSFQSIRHPIILTPGGNDWTDCHLAREPEINPLERLAKVRAVFYPEGRSLGQRTIPVESQANVHPQFGKFRENLRWSATSSSQPCTSPAATTISAALSR